MSPEAVSPDTIDGQAVAPGVVSPGSVDSTVEEVSYYTKSDWEYYFENPDPEEDFFRAAEEIASNSIASTPSDNERPKWRVDSTGKDVKVTFGEASTKVWTVGKAEIEEYRMRMQKLADKEYEELERLIVKWF